jgi:GT2 family glycosyltransferase
MTDSGDFPRLAVLLVCFNRRDLTLRALRSLKRHRFSARLTPVMFDDSSTDGTPEAVRAAFPDTLIVHGNGCLYWNGGLFEAWKRAASLAVEGYLWLNDDVELDPDALDVIHDAWSKLRAAGKNRFILAGATRGPDGTVTYSGYDKAFTPFAFRLRRVVPDGHLRPIDTFNGNIVIVPNETFAVMGPNDPAFFHLFGDTDYGLRARAAGIDVLLLPRTIGTCAPNAFKREHGFTFGSRAAQLSLGQRWRIANTHIGLPPRTWLHLTRRHSGVWWPLHFLLEYRWLIVPRWIQRLRRGNTKEPRA